MISDPDYKETTEFQRDSKRLALLIQHFWSRWRQEYLTSLREFHKASGNNEARVRVGDIVLVHDEGPRINWKLAVVESLLPGKDGHVRSVNIRTEGGRTNRPITKLYPIEVTHQNGNDPVPISQTDHRDGQANQCYPRRIATRRAAAARAVQRIGNWARELVAPPEDVEKI